MGLLLKANSAKDPHQSQVKKPSAGGLLKTAEKKN